MKKKIVQMLVCVVCICIALSGCKKNVGNPEDNAIVEEKKEDVQEQLVFGYSCGSFEDAYHQMIYQSLSHVLAEEGHQVILKNAENDAQRQMRELTELAEKQVDAVYVCPIEENTILPGLEALKEADIPVINIGDRITNDYFVTARVSVDDKNAGYVCGIDLKQQYPEGGRVLILENSAEESVNSRITGFEQAIMGAGFEIVKRIDVSINGSDTKTQLSALLSGQEQVDAIMCANDKIAMEALAYLEESDRRDVLVYGIDGSPEFKQKLNEPGSQAAGTGARVPVRIGESAAKIGIAVLTEGKYEKETVEDTFLINSGNVELYGADGWQ